MGAGWKSKRMKPPANRCVGNVVVAAAEAVCSGRACPAEKHHTEVVQVPQAGRYKVVVVVGRGGVGWGVGEEMLVQRTRTMGG